MAGPLIPVRYTKPIDRAAAEVGRNPGILDAILDQTSDTIGEFRGSMSSDAERDAQAGARSTIIEAALMGLAREGHVEEAKDLLESGEYDADLTPATRDY